MSRQLGRGSDRTCQRRSTLLPRTLSTIDIPVCCVVNKYAVRDVGVDIKTWFYPTNPQHDSDTREEIVHSR